MKVGIIGLGLIGGSMAIDLKRRGFADEVLGVEAEPVNASAAEKIGLVDKVVGLDECVRECDVTVLAVPVGAAVKMLPGARHVCCRTSLRECGEGGHGCVLDQRASHKSCEISSGKKAVCGLAPDGRY